MGRVSNGYGDVAYEMAMPRHMLSLLTAYDLERYLAPSTYATSETGTGVYTAGVSIRILVQLDGGPRSRMGVWKTPVTESASSPGT